MKVFLLHRDEDIRVKPELDDELFEAMRSSNPFAVEYVKRNQERERDKYPAAFARRRMADDELEQDLELPTLWNAMAGGDSYLYEVAKRATLSSLAEPEAILYRQQVLADCLEQRDAVRELYGLALEALEAERRVGGVWSGVGPNLILSRSVKMLREQVVVLKRLRKIADEEAARFDSEGFARFLAMLREELDDEYLHLVDRHLHELELPRGLLESAELAKGFKGDRYLVRTQRLLGWKERYLPGKRPPSFSFSIAPRDENGARALEEIRNRGLNHVADAVARSADHVASFFSMLRLELAFYLGCVNLHERLEEKGGPTCFPTPVPADEVAFAGEGLYDVCLAFHLEQQVVGNDVAADGKSLVMITGANQGGKSTFLRSVGLAQLMMQAGMFVGARSLRANVASGVFSHYKREEDASMEGGKLDEELARMSSVADRITRGSLLLCNESFASTNEREGSEIARQVVRAMLEREVKVFFVTHLYDLAHGFHAQRLPTAQFLRAERRPDGSRTFKLLEREPLATSFGEDSYRRIFGDTAADAKATAW